MKAFVTKAQTTTAKSTSLWDNSIFTVLAPFQLPSDFESGQSVTAIVLPPGESLSALRTSAEAALEQCKFNHRNNGVRYNMNIAAVSVTNVGIDISEDGDLSYYIEVDEANCDALARDMYAIMCSDSDHFVAVRTTR